MRRITAIMLLSALCFVLLWGCGAKYDAEESTVFVLKDGKIVSTDVDDFDEEKYDEEELEEYVDGQISAYNEENGKNSVKLENLSVKDGKAVLTLEYQDWSDYKDFYGVELFSGSVSEALSMGYTFDAEFAAVKDGKPTPCKASDFFENSSYKVLIIKANTNVQVKGTICYVSSENVSLVDKKTVSIRPGNRLFEDEEATEELGATETVGTEENSADAGSVGEDELDMGTEDPEEITFEFEEETEKDTGAAGAVFTYIVYK